MFVKLINSIINFAMSKKEEGQIGLKVGSLTDEVFHKYNANGT